MARKTKGQLLQLGKNTLKNWKKEENRSPNYNRLGQAEKGLPHPWINKHTDPEPKTTLGDILKGLTKREE